MFRGNIQERRFGSWKQNSVGLQKPIALTQILLDQPPFNAYNVRLFES
jgi:hypothetical protein